MTLHTRLSQLERRHADRLTQHEARCETCWSWGVRTAVVSRGVLISESRPARCPNCGFSGPSPIQSIIVERPEGV